jgi:hypothetical protein
MTTPTTRNLLAVLTLFTALIACTSLPGTTTSPPSAQTVVTQLAQHIPTTTPGVTYTADTDSNHLLGRPNGYLSKATFTDSRVQPPSHPSPWRLAAPWKCSPTSRAPRTA